MDVGDVFDDRGRSFTAVNAENLSLSLPFNLPPTIVSRIRESRFRESKMLHHVLLTTYSESGVHSHLPRAFLSQDMTAQRAPSHREDQLLQRNPESVEVPDKRNQTLNPALPVKT